jgi:hypothetical protein
MAFKYRKRDAKAVEDRASQQGGDFVGFIKDEYRVYTPRKGDNHIRILPPTWDKPKHYGLDVHVHYGIGPDNAAALCIAKMPDPETGELSRCPLCEARAKAERAGDEELAKSLRNPKRVLVWLLDKKEPDKGPLLWAMPWTVDRDIAKISRDKRSGETFLIDDPEEGYDISFDKEGDGMTTKYVGFQLSRRPSSVDEEHLDYIEEHPLPDVMIYRDYDKLLELYEGGPAPPPKKKRRDDDEDEDEAPVRKRPRISAPDDEEELPRPKKRRAEPDEDEEELPRPKKAKRPPVDDEDEDEPPPPKKKRPPVDEEDDDEEEAPPPKKRPRMREPVEEDETPVVRKKRPHVEEDDEDEDEPPPPKLKKRVVVPPPDDEDEDEPPPPKKKKRRLGDAVDEDEIPFDGARPAGAAERATRLKAKIRGG